jgi:hypothetical protein
MGLGESEYSVRQRAPAQSPPEAQGSPFAAPFIIVEVTQLPEYGSHVRPLTQAGCPIAGTSAHPGKHPRLSGMFESHKKQSPEYCAHSFAPGLHAGMQLER